MTGQIKMNKAPIAHQVKLVFLLVALLMISHQAHATKYIRPYSICMGNLGRIEGAAQQWALDNQQPQDTVYSLSDRNYLAYFPSNQLPQCPRGGVYVAGTNINDAPKCSLHGTIKTAYERDEELVVKDNKKRLFWPISSVIAGLLLLSPISHIPERFRQILALPISVAYAVCFAPFYFILLVSAGHAGDIRPFLIFTTISGGVILSLMGLRSSLRHLRSFQYIALGYHGVFLVSAMMHLVWVPL